MFPLQVNGLLYYLYCIYIYIYHITWCCRGPLGGGAAFTDVVEALAEVYGEVIRSDPRGHHRVQDEIRGVGVFGEGGAVGGRQGVGVRHGLCGLLRRHAAGGHRGDGGGHPDSSSSSGAGASSGGLLGVLRFGRTGRGSGAGGLQGQQGQENCGPEERRVKTCHACGLRVWL